MSTAEQFRELVKKASKDKIVKEEAKKLAEKNNFEWKELSGDELRKYIFRLGQNIIAVYARQEAEKKLPLTAESFPPLTGELVRFTGQFEPAMKSGIKPSDPDFVACKDPKEGLGITFDQIAGQEEAKQQIEMQYIYPINYPGLFGSKAKGILFYGPPGTGKSLLAKAATAELKGVAFYDPSPGELKGKYEGDTEKNISRVFECAQEEVENPESPYSFAVIFIDEFDSLAGKGRENDSSMRRSVNTLLQMMDGIKSSPAVSVIAATNYPWTIDDAINRRFGSKVLVDLPDDDARKFLILQALAKAYSEPNIPMKDRDKGIIVHTDPETGEIEWRTDFLDNIDVYGVPLCRREGVKGSTYLNIDDVDTLMEEMGPTKEGLKIISDIREGKTVDPNDWADKQPIFGYSASDIIKVMELAVQNAAFNALASGLFATMKFGNEEWYVSTSVPVTTVRKEKIKASYAVNEETAEKWDDYPLRILPDDKRAKLINFSICEDDTKRAMNNYPTTIKNKPYIEILNFRHQGIVPEKDGF